MLQKHSKYPHSWETTKSRGVARSGTSGHYRRQLDDVPRECSLWHRLAHLWLVQCLGSVSWTFAAIWNMSLHPYTCVCPAYLVGFLPLNWSSWMDDLQSALLSLCWLLSDSQKFTLTMVITILKLENFGLNTVEDNKLHATDGSDHTLRRVPFFLHWINSRVSFVLFHLVFDTCTVLFMSLSYVCLSCLWWNAKKILVFCPAKIWLSGFQGEQM